jgi:hypothetical protein
MTAAASLDSTTGALVSSTAAILNAGGASRQAGPVVLFFTVGN